MYVIKSGELFQVEDGTQKEFHSPFAEDYHAEDNRHWENESWKYKKDDGDTERDMIPRSMLWGGRGVKKAPDRVKFNAVCGAPGRLYYVLQMATACGLFYFDFGANEETRVFHRTEFKPRGLYIDEDYAILTTIDNSDATTHLVEYDANGKHAHVLTSGDCRDENPFRVGSAIYYQSSGLARNAQGIQVAMGPTSINKLDPKSGEIETLIESEKFDYLLPRVGLDGTVYCIRTPYHIRPPYPLKNLLLDIVLFPWRICLAIFGFLNVFSMFFAKTPLTTAGGPDPRKLDVSKRIMHNRLVNLEETWKKEGRKVAVSKDWKLIKRVENQDVEIASNVLWFDLDELGKPIYTDGYSLYDSAGKSTFKADELVSCIGLRRDTGSEAAD